MGVSEMISGSSFEVMEVAHLLFPRYVPGWAQVFVVTGFSLLPTVKHPSSLLFLCCLSLPRRTFPRLDFPTPIGPYMMILGLGIHLV